MLCTLAALTVAAGLTGCVSEEVESAVESTAAPLIASADVCVAGHCVVKIVVPKGVPETQVAIGASYAAHINDRSSVESTSGVTPVVAAATNWTRAGVDSNFGHFLSLGKKIQVANTNTATRKMYGDIYTFADYPEEGRSLWESLQPYFSNRVLTRFDVLPVAQERVIWSFDWPSSSQGNLSYEPPNDTGVAEHSVAPGSYGDVTVKRGNRLLLSPGAYFFQSLNLDAGSSLVADTSGSPARLAVGGSLMIKGAVRERRKGENDWLRVSDNGSLSRFLLAYVGSGSVTIEGQPDLPPSAVNPDGVDNSGVDGVLVAPAASVSLNATTLSLDGAVFAHDVELHQDRRVRGGFSGELLEDPGTAPKTVPTFSSATTRFVAGIGYLEGDSCEAWPSDLELKSALASMHAEQWPELVGTAGVGSELLGRLVDSQGKASVTQIGSKTELLLTRYVERPWVAALGVGRDAVPSLESQWVAVDVVAGVGYDLSARRLCRQKDLGAGLCSLRKVPLSVQGVRTDITVLGLSDAVKASAKQSEIIDAMTDRSPKSVSLVAPVVTVEPFENVSSLYGAVSGPQRIELDVNTLISALKLRVGARKDGKTPALVEFEVRPRVEPSARSLAEVARPSVPGVVGIFAGSISGVSQVSTYDGTAVERIRCYTAPGYAKDTVAFWRVQSPDTAWGAGSDLEPRFAPEPHSTHTATELHVAASSLGALPSSLRSARAYGGVAKVFGPSDGAIELHAPVSYGLQAVNCLGAPQIPESSQLLPFEFIERNGSVTEAYRLAQYLSAGTFTRLLAERAESTSTVAGIPSADYETARDVIDSIDPHGKNLLGIGAETRQMVRALAVASDNPNAAVSLNALGLSYGQVVRPWSERARPFEASSLATMKLNWLQAYEVSQDFQSALAAQDVAQSLGAISSSLTSVAEAAALYGDTAQAASRDDAVGQTAAAGRLSDAKDTIASASGQYLKEVCTISKADAIGCTCSEDAGAAGACTWDHVAQAVKNQVNVAVEACKARSASGGWLDLVKTIGEVCPYVKGAVAVFDEIESALQQGQQGISYLGLLDPKEASAFEGSLKAMYANDSTMAALKSMSASFTEAQSKLEKGLGSLGAVDRNCKTDDPAYTAAMSALMGLSTARTLVTVMAAQSQTLESLLQSVDSTIRYQTINQAAAAQLHETADAAASTVSMYASAYPTEINERAAYLRSSCKAVAAGIRASESDLIGMTQRLQTAAGWTHTTPGAVVPAVHTFGGGEGPKTNATAPLVTSVWDAQGMDKWFSGSSGSLSQLVETRWKSFFYDACGNHLNSGLPSTMFVVRKQLNPDELRSLTSFGFARFSVGLDELTNAAEEFADVSTRVSGVSVWPTVDSQPWKRALAAPVVLDAYYVGCFGEGDEPCCATPGCRAPLSGQSGGGMGLAHFSGVTVPTTQGCSAGISGNWSASGAAMDLPGANGDVVKTDVGTCLDSVSSSAEAWPIYLQPDSVMGQTRSWFCNVDPAAISLAGMKGTPLLGDWAIAKGLIEAGSLASLQLSEVQRQGGVGSVILDSSQWTATDASVASWANSFPPGLRAVEIAFVVAAEPIADTAAPSYVFGLYPASWRD